MSEKVSYFGYGANRDPRMMGWITKRDPETLVGQPAALEGYGLAVQRLDQVPNVATPDSPIPKSARDLLEESWKDDFTSYVIFPRTDGQVAGVIWELTPEERERVRDWELIDFGWYEDTNGMAKTLEGQRVPVITERLGPGQQYDREVDGLHYETWLNDPEKFRIVAEKAALEYDERLGPEGGRPNPDINKA